MSEHFPGSDPTGGNDPANFKFVLPQALDGASEQATAAMQLAAISEGLALEDRTLLWHVNGRAENVSEHSGMLVIIAPVLSERYYPDLNSGLVARFAGVHDIVEAYVGDTPTNDISAEGLTAKWQLEQTGLKKLQHDFAHLPEFVRLVVDYETQRIPEARFVRVCDKLLPLLLHLVEGGATVRTHLTAEKLLQNSAERAAALRLDYPEFEMLIALREELAALTVREFL